MQTSFSRSDAVVVPFAAQHPPRNRLTVSDRIDALAWHDAKAVPAGARIAIHGRDADDPPEVGDYLVIYRAGEDWAVWGAARQGAAVTVWHGPSGSDLGRFPNMREALAAVSSASLRPRARR